MSDPFPEASSEPTGVRERERITLMVRAFYERYPFPEVRHADRDGLIVMRSLARDLASWGGARRMRIADVGCGTGNTLVSLARRFPDAEFVGFDLAARPLELARSRVEAAALTNVRLEQYDLLREDRPEGMFDRVLCLGVLHHTADMPLGLSHLGELMGPEGRLLLWLYGRHGRYRHTLNQRLLAMLMEPTLEDPIAVARDYCRSFGARAVVDLFGEHAPIWQHHALLQSESWLADQLLHPNERCVDMEELLTLAERAGLQLHDWLGVDTTPEAHFQTASLVRCFDALSGSARLIALDLLLKPSSYLVALGHRTDPER
jgi:2-polyprenyl-3-methyl-5-hydroxy-6-metoxy-1,4-benzoquinol methylase